MIVYHAITTFHLIESWVHKLLFHNNEETLFLYDDVMDEKFTNLKKLEEKGIFSKVYPIPYRKSPRKREKLDEWVNSIFDNLDIRKANKIYVAGGQFYFSYWLIKEQIPFTFCEEASGRLSKPEVVMENDKILNMLRYDIAIENSMYTGEHELVTEKIYNKKAQTENFFDDKAVDFDVVEGLSRLNNADRLFILSYFNAPINLEVEKKSVVMLTQHFTNLKMMSLNQQVELYEQTFDYYLKDYRPIIKVHPDDQIFYKKIIKNSMVIDKKFPSELLPYIFTEIPEKIATISSTGIYSFLDIFENSLNFNPAYESNYIKNHQLYLICYVINNVVTKKDITVKYTGTNWVQICNMLHTFELNGISDEFGEFAIYDAFVDEKPDEKKINIILDPGKHTHLLEWMKKNQNRIAIKKINIYKRRRLFKREKVLFYYTDNKLLERILKMSYIKKLENSELEIVVLENSELENRVNILEALLETTENRLAELIEKEVNQ